ncbi:MAG: alpha/beta hydrolase [Nitrospirae bacterium]|nr:alpha/beta hydrolase [Nitrospirota bacterium]
MGDNFIVCVRNKEKDGTFGEEPGDPRYLLVPDGEVPHPSQTVPWTQWFDAVIGKAWTRTDIRPDSPPELLERDLSPTGDLLVFVHGYNTDLKKMMNAHRLLRDDLARRGFKGALVTFAWPSAGSRWNYLEDRSDATQTALHLVKSCILPLSIQQQAGCRINVHVLAHSTGAYVIREAFDKADDNGRISRTNWITSQMMLIGADISSELLAAGNSASESLFRHCIRLTNYYNGNDYVLSASGAKRLGLAPRAGRVGPPQEGEGEPHPKSVYIDCGNYWVKLDENQATKVEGSVFAHSWYFGDPVFTLDMVETIRGEVDRHRIKTRRIENGKLVLSKPI